MRYHALACDYDGTIAHDGLVDERTIEALEQVRRSGRKVILVTGRELDDLILVCPRLDLFDRVVAENGALLYRPSTREEKKLAEAPPEEFARELARRGADRVSVGRVIVATWEPHETTAVEVIRDLGLELQVIFNKGAVMILPSGVNKATGLHSALLELGLSVHNVVGVGDAENDHAFLHVCECSVAVANALETLKQNVDWVTSKGHGEGTSELCRALIDSDLSHVEGRHNRLSIGKAEDGSEIIIPPYGTNVLIAGSSGGGKSTLATSFIERLEERCYQCVIVDPEGDYSTFDGGVLLGNKESAPSVQEVLDVLSKPDQSVAVNLTGIGLKERPAFLEALLPRLQELRARTGRPHWILIDEAHHMLPSSRKVAGFTVPQEMSGLMLITLEPDRVAPAILPSIDVVIAIGENPEATMRTFAEAVGERPPRLTRRTLNPGEAVAWFRGAGKDPVWFRSTLPRVERRRHRRKYAEGQLPPDLCFYFRGPAGKLKLRAQNLAMFLQMAEGVDDDTWLFHLKEGDISRWFRTVIKDPELAAHAEKLEKVEITAEQSRKRIRTEIEQRYILAA
ncbi:MAG TPA: HAD-IIB family hydrolase [Terriglobia bacterium]|nr:HAD-IIB family hydrolase [Terriglobia bacterium]